jgi:hypothetical protein
MAYVFNRDYLGKEERNGKDDWTLETLLFTPQAPTTNEKVKDEESIIINPNTP